MALLACGFGFGLVAGAGPDWLGPGAQYATAGASPVGAAASAPVVATIYPAEVLRVLDGDTFEARVRVWPGLDITTKVRLRGIDAPELRAACAEERKKAQAARDALSTMLADGQVSVAAVRLDKYGGRVVAEVATAALPSIAAALLDAGHARRYAGGRRASWCSVQPG